MKPAHFLSDLHLSPSAPRRGSVPRLGTRAGARRRRGLRARRPLRQLARRRAARRPVRVRRGRPARGHRASRRAGGRDARQPRFPAGRAVRARGGRDAACPSVVVVDVGGVPTLLLHGDTLCTDDVDYQRYRAWIRDPSRQRKLLSLPWPVRRAFAAWLRRAAGTRAGNKGRRDHGRQRDGRAPARCAQRTSRAWSTGTRTGRRRTRSTWTAAAASATCWRIGTGTPCGSRSTRVARSGASSLPERCDDPGWAASPLEARLAPHYTGGTPCPGAADAPDLFSTPVVVRAARDHRHRPRARRRQRGGDRSRRAQRAAESSSGA